MEQKEQAGLDFEIDILTHSIVNVQTGESLPTDIFVEPRELTEEDRRVFSKHIRDSKARMSPEEREHSKAYGEALRAMRRLGETKRRWLASQKLQAAV